MKTFNLFSKKEDSLPEGRADFLLATSVTKTYKIDSIALTPTLEAEFISDEKLHSMSELPETQKGAPTPALITRAVHNLNAFSSIEIIDLGLEVSPQNCIIHNLGIKPSESIYNGANIDAKDIILKGMALGRSYELKGSYLILGESVPDGIISAKASVLALGYKLKHEFSSTHEVLNLITDDMSNLEKLSHTCDNMLLFCAGFLLEASRRFHVILAGGMQMATCLLIADALREDLLMRVKSDNITLATTAWVANDKNSDMVNILSQLSYQVHAIYTSFSFANAQIPILKKYDEGEAKEGVGAGASLAYAHKNNINNDKILQNIEYMMYCI